MRRVLPVVLGSILVLVAAGDCRAQTAAERCLAMRLALLGATVSTQLHCHAWSVATRTPASDGCLAHGEDALARQLRDAGCASEEEIATLLELARSGTDALLGSQVAGSRVAELEGGLWNTEAIVDFGRTYQPGMSWPDTSCRSTGHCENLHIVRCDTTLRADGGFDTSCKSVPESKFQTDTFPVFLTENVALPTGEILARATDGGVSLELVITLSPDGSTYTGAGSFSTTPVFVTGRRVR